MKAKALYRLVTAGALSLLLAACGGGGGDGNDGAFTPPSQTRIAASASAATVPAGGTLAVTVNVTTSSGGAIVDGTVVNASVSPSTAGGIFGVRNGVTQAVSTTVTTGGVAEFVFITTQAQGPVNLTFSTQPAGQSVSVSASLAVTVTAPAPSGNITIEATRTQLPVNLFGVSPFFGSPYMSELTINARSASGQPISIPRGEDGGLGVTINPVSIAAYSTLDDPETDGEDENEFLILVGQGPVNLVAGRATVFVHSFNQTGTAIVTASVQDPETGRLITTTQAINVVSSTSPLPSVIQLFTTFSGIYTQGSGGPSSGALEVTLTDAIGQPAPDPVAGNVSFNNIRVELIGDASAAANERVSGQNAAGATVSGQTIAIRSTNGSATFTFIAGTRLGQTTVRVTTDRADNNVDNGISDPVVAERTVVISDGRLFALQLTSPITDAIRENRVTSGEGGLLEGQDGTYSLTVSALATDRQGNPVLAGTPVEFGLVDSPLAGFPNEGSGRFIVSGGDGNPLENGFLFSAPSGAFQISAGGVGPGDTLLVLGQSVPGNRDLESARTISQVSSQTSLSVAQRFNRNDDTGASVDNGNVLPYLVGRATHGNIVARAFTDANGVATTRMNFPVSRLGQSVAVWARGSATTSTGTKLITDIEGYVYPGIAPLSIIASPSVIPGNTTASVTVCLRDALDSPIQGAFIGFGFSLESGTGTIGGRSSGALPDPTGSNGCVVVQVVTSGMSEDGDNLVEFSLGDAEPATVEIRVAADLILQASPTAFIGNGTFTVNLRLIDGAGNPVAGRAIGVECSGDGDTAVVSVTSPPSLTDSAGASTAQLTASLMDQPDGGAEWECVFSLAGGEPSATVLFKGRDSCAGGDGFSPPAQQGDCGTTTTPVVLTVTAGGPTAFSFLSSPGGLACSHPGGTAPATVCAGTFNSGTDVSLILPPPPFNFAVTGSCSRASGSNVVVIPSLSAPTACTINSL